MNDVRPVKAGEPNQTLNDFYDPVRALFPILPVLVRNWISLVLAGKEYDFHDSLTTDTHRVSPST